VAATWKREDLGAPTLVTRHPTCRETHTELLHLCLVTRDMLSIGNTHPTLHVGHYKAHDRLDDFNSNQSASKDCLISRVRASGSDLLAHRLGPKPVKKQRRQPPIAPTSLEHDCRQTIGPTDYGLETARETQDVLAFLSSFRQLDIQACDPVDEMVRLNMEVEWESSWGLVMCNEYQTLLHIVRLQTLRGKTSSLRSQHASM
jgi:hypothetical protein